MEEQANALAALLRSKYDVRERALVGVYMERDERLIVALLAVLKVGAAYVPLDPLYPAERIAMMLEDSDAKVILTTEAIRSKVPASALRTCVCVDDPGTLDDMWNVGDDAGVLREVKSTPSDRAYVIFT